MENINSWKDSQWFKIEKQVFRLQLRIYKASANQDFEKMYKIQKLLIASESAKYLSRKLVREDHCSKMIPVFKSSKSKPTNRLSFCNISNLEDKSKQMLIYFALSPQWEAKFETENKVFRPKKSIVDSIEAIFVGISRNPKWVLTAEISKSLNQINYDYLLEKCNTFPELRQQLRFWFKTGSLEINSWPESGNYLSSLLLDIIFYGLGKNLSTYLNTFHQDRLNFIFIRYGTKFLSIDPDYKVLIDFQKIILEFFETSEFQLNSETTIITHTLLQRFKFFGFNISQRAKWVKNQKMIPNGKSTLQFITILTPSNKSLKKHKYQLRDIIRRYRGTSQEKLIQKLNPIIREWVLAQPPQISCKIFQGMDKFMFLHIWKWVKRRHPRISNYKLREKYWHQVEPEKWIFSVKTSDKRIRQLELHAKVIRKS